MTEEIPNNTVAKVFQAVNAVQADLAEIGIAKSRRNQQQGYQFRGIDEVYNTLAPLLSKHKLLIIPNVLERQITERVSKRGDALFSVCVYTEFTFVSAEDGSNFKARTFGEAMDSADKATNKAMSAAYKYVCLQTFSIPTSGDNDADDTTHEVAAAKAPAKTAKAPAKATVKKEPATKEPADIFAGIESKHADALRKAQTPQDLLSIIEGVKMQMGDSFQDVRSAYTACYKARLKELQGGK